MAENTHQDKNGQGHAEKLNTGSTQSAHLLNETYIQTRKMKPIVQQNNQQYRRRSSQLQGPAYAQSRGDDYCSEGAEPQIGQPAG